MNLVYLNTKDPAQLTKIGDVNDMLGNINLELIDQWL
jgi:hypothetical protein